MLLISQFYLKTFRPFMCGLFTRIFYFGRGVKIHPSFKSDGIPRILIDSGCELIIGKHVVFRSDVEIRAHGKSKIIIEDDTRIDRGVRILAANQSQIILGEGCRIGLYSVLNGGDSITIGKKALVSGFVYLQTSMHSYSKKNKSIQDQGYIHAPVNLGSDTWLGTHSVILPGVSIGCGAIVGSNAVVTKTIQAYEIVAGIPAKPLKSRT